MRAIGRLATLCALALLALLGVVAAPAAASPVLNLDVHHNQTHFPPGGDAELWFDIDNVGDAATAGPVTLTAFLPGGLTRHSVYFEGHGGNPLWNCPGSAGDTIVTCTTSEPIPRHTVVRNVVLRVGVHPAASGTRFASASVAGGGAAEGASASELVHISEQPPGFGIVEGSFLADFFEADGRTTERRAGSHPDNLSVSFDFNTVSGSIAADGLRKNPDGTVRNLEVELPPGFVGAPTAVGECQAAAFTVDECLPSSQVGRADLTIYPPTNNHFYTVSSPVYNMVHPRGTVADLAFKFADAPVHIKATLDPANAYAVGVSVSDINETLPAFHSKVTTWGVPAASSHDSERCGSELIVTDSECPTGTVPKPFLTVPAQCDSEVAIRLHRYDSWQQPGDFGPALTRQLPGRFEDCERPRFDPSISLRPTGREAATPTGLDVSVHVPQNENPNALATPPIKQTTVTLPEGMTVNPAFADGLSGCSEAEIGLRTARPVGCPDSSRIGEVELSTPLLPGPLEGSMYLATQQANPFGSLIAFYIAMHDTEQRGVLVKVPGHVELDPRTGRILTSFDDLPQFPFEDLTLRFRSGERAPLVNPPTCGVHRIEATMRSYAQPEEELDLTNAYTVSAGPGGGGCVSSLGERRFEPRLKAGTLSPVAGAFSPLALRVSRDDADQEIAAVEGTVPPGFSASIADVPQCSEAEIAAAIRRGAPGEGRAERDDPSCPAASQVGTVDTGAGAGPAPIYVPGRIYLAGPYKGAPLSGVAIVPAVAGPIDLGVVVVRAPAYIDPLSGRISIRSDALPQVVNGVLIRVRDVRIHLDRPRFTINPTNCREMGFSGTLFSVEGRAKELFNRFQIGECASLGFKPRIAVRLRGSARRGAHPALRAVVRPRPGDANFARAAVTLPTSAFLDQAHIRTICTRLQFAAGAGHGTSCPRGAIYGSARAWSPLVEGAFEGPVFLRSSANRLPDMVLALRGPSALPVEIELSSRIDSVRVGRGASGIRSIFAAIPDVPVSRFVLDMQGGKKGLIVNSRHLCRRPARNRARANLHGQNGRRAQTKPRVVAQKCAKRRKAKRAR